MGPKPEIAVLFEHLIDLCQQGWEAERLGGLVVDRHLKLGRPFNRPLVGFLRILCT
jgi:hypothetical protein